MSTTSTGSDAAIRPAGGSARRFRLTLWPLWASVAGAFGFAGSIIFDVRPQAELDAFAKGEVHTVTPADLADLDAFGLRLGWMAGLVAVVALLVFAGVWRRHVESRFPSAAARMVSAGVIATAGAAALGYGWKGALANYLGSEAGYYDETGVFVYYMLNDFGAYLPWIGVWATTFAVVWMAFAERIVSRVLAVVTAVFGFGLGALMLITGVPGMPGTLVQLWLVLLGLWLAVGRSRVTAPEEAR